MSYSSAAEVLAALTPAVENALARHLETAKEWFPHEYVPYERGRNFVDEPWEPSQSALSDIARIAFELNLLTEDNLPYYHLALWQQFGADGPWGEWARRWTATRSGWSPAWPRWRAPVPVTSRMWSTAVTWTRPVPRGPGPSWCRAG